MFKNLLIYILLIISGGVSILYYLLSDKYNKQNLQVRVLTKQINGLTSQVNNINRPNDNIRVYYSPVTFNTGEVMRRCSLYISPLSNSTILRQLTSGTKVKIIDSVEVLETLWYEVHVLCADNSNTRGFLHQDCIKELKTVETQIVSNRYR